MNRGLDGLLIKSALGIGKATLSAAGLTAARAFTLPDQAGTLALLSAVTSRNAIINSDMRIAQRGTSFAAIANAAYSLDRWRYEKVGTAVHTASQQTDVPTLAQAGVLLTNSLRLALTTASTSIAAGDFVFIGQGIEGFYFSPLAQRALILSFWVKAGVIGTYCASLRNSVSDRSCVIEFTVNVADTWEYKTLTFPASPSAGTWDYGAGLGLNLGFALACGSTFQATAGGWQTGNFIATSGQVNGVNTGAGNFQLTAVQLEVGTVASPFAVQSFVAELALCQRYYEKSYLYADAPGAVTSTGRIVERSVGTGHIITIPFSVTKRASVTLGVYSPATGASGVYRDLDSAADRSVGTSSAGATFYAIDLSSSVAGNANAIQWTASAEL